MKRYTFILLFLISPLFCSASLEITEIMYDQEGADTGLEWIEIRNTGDTSIDVSTWYLKENESYHHLLAEGDALLSPGSFAIITQDLAYGKTLAAGTLLLKSSFSLHNEGEALTLANSEKEDQYSFSYTSALGGSGNSLSIQYLNGMWQEALPSPGYIPELNGTDDIEDKESGDEEKEAGELVKQDPSYDLELDFPDILFAGTSFPLAFRVYREEGSLRSLQIKGVYRLNFGDGQSVLRERYIQEEHRYMHPGRYTLFLEYYPSKVWFDAQTEPLLVVQKELKVYPLDVLLLGPYDDGSLDIINHLPVDLDLSGWRIQSGDLVYVFPAHSLLAADTSLRISRAALGFFAYTGSYIQLVNQDFVHVDHLPKEVIVEASSEEAGEVAPLIEEHHIVLPQEDLYFPEIEEEALEKKSPLHLVFFLCIFVILSVLRMRYIKRRD